MDIPIIMGWSSLKIPWDSMNGSSRTAEVTLNEAWEMELSNRFVRPWEMVLGVLRRSSTGGSFLISKKGTRSYPNLSIYLSIYLFVCLFVCLSVCLSICWSIYLFVCLSIYLSICLSIYINRNDSHRGMEGKFGIRRPGAFGIGHWMVKIIVKWSTGEYGSHLPFLSTCANCTRNWCMQQVLYQGAWYRYLLSAYPVIPSWNWLWSHRIPSRIAASTQTTNPTSQNVIPSLS